MSTATSAGLTLAIDWTACEGRGLCLELLPEVLGADPWGYPMDADGRRHTGRGFAVPAAQAADAQRAVAACPRLALRLTGGT